ncbi:cytochrome ubiquinol oxidase subunit I [Anaplasmataceae bacterium AB001_6]|nr:cytochrome ubiquinol oxidase subunit I [Anaplasmataceae bacterium AB001_6]
MFELLTDTFLSRVQFAFTVSFHIIFPALSIGSATFLAIVEGLWYFSGKKLYEDIYKFWLKIFAISFGLGVVSGIVLSFEIGANWSHFSQYVGNVLGPLLGYEVLTAFFLEASFLGIMIYGMGKVSPKMHFVSTVIVAVGTTVSAFWILSANSWMQTPTGFYIGSDGLLYPKKWLDIIFNPSFVVRMVHMLIASYITTSFVLSGVACYFLLKRKFLEHAKFILQFSMSVLVILVPLQLLAGDQHGLNSFEHQPLKIAAIESVWETKGDVPFTIFGIPSQKKEETNYAIKIPYLGSLLLTHSLHGEIPGLKEVDPKDRPHVATVFFAFRIMILCWCIMLASVLSYIYLKFKKRQFTSRVFQYFNVVIAPIGFIALLAGWFVTEVGRQPYVVYDLLRTSDAASNLHIAQVSLSLALFVFVYLTLFGFGAYYMVTVIKKGPVISKKDNGDVDSAFVRKPL